MLWSGFDSSRVVVLGSLEPQVGSGLDDSLHLRRFCLIGIDQRVPDESTVRKLTRRLGVGVVPRSPGW